MKNYGEMILDLRLQAGMSRRTLSKRSGVAEATIKWWEDGLRMPTVYNFSRVLKALDSSYVLGIGDTKTE